MRYFEIYFALGDITSQKCKINACFKIVGLEKTMLSINTTGDKLILISL